MYKKLRINAGLIANIQKLVQKTILQKVYSIRE